MGAEIADDEGGAGLRRIGAPGRLLAFGFAGAGYSQPSANSTCTTRTAPSSPASISARASGTIG